MAATSLQTSGVLTPLPLTPLPHEPLVSVLLANYNYAEYIKQSIESVLAQTYKNWELIICDDGSTDNSLAVIKAYSSLERICVFEKENGGHTSALNLAFSKCKGDVICLLDSDDLFMPNKLEALVDAYAADPEAGLVVHRVLRVNGRRKHQGVYPLSQYPDGWLGPDLLNSGGIVPCGPPTSGISFRREIGESLFPISLECPLDICPDQVIMRIAPLMTALRRLPAVLAEYRVHSHNAYTQRQLSASAITRQLTLSRALWEEQNRFLAGLAPQLTLRMADHSQSSFTAQLEYIEAKLQNDPKVHERLQNYLSRAVSDGNLKWLGFWRRSIHLPNVIFLPAVNLLLGQGWIKQAVSRLRKIA